MPNLQSLAETSVWVNGRVEVPVRVGVRAGAIHPLGWRLPTAKAHGNGGELESPSTSDDRQCNQASQQSRKYGFYRETRNR